MMAVSAIETFWITNDITRLESRELFIRFAYGSKRSCFRRVMAPQSLLGALQPILQLHRLCGMAPVHLAGQSQLRTSWVAIVYSTLFWTWVIVSKALTLAVMDLSDAFKGLNLIILLIQYGLVFASNAAAYIQAMSTVATFRAVYTELEIIDHKLGPDHKFYSSLFWFQVLLLTFSLLLVALEGLLEGLHDQTYNVFWTVSEYVTVSEQIHFAMLVLVLRHYWSLVNARLASSRCRGRPWGFSSLHMALLRVSELIATLHSAQTLLIFVTQFATVTYGVYFILLNFAEHPQCSTDFLAVIAWTVWTTIAGLRIVAYVLPCVFAMREAGKTGKILFKAMAKPENSDFLDEMKRFSLQLLHFKIEFPVCGFFSFNLPLLTAMFGGITTYLIIILQFQISLQQPELNNTYCYGQLSYVKDSKTKLNYE